MNILFIGYFSGFFCGFFVSLKNLWLFLLYFDIILFLYVYELSFLFKIILNVDLFKKWGVFLGGIIFCFLIFVKLYIVFIYILLLYFYIFFDGVLLLCIFKCIIFLFFLILKIFVGEVNKYIFLFKFMIWFNVGMVLFLLESWLVKFSFGVVCLFIIDIIWLFEIIYMVFVWLIVVFFICLLGKLLLNLLK